MDGSRSPYRSRPSRKTPAAAWLGQLRVTSQGDRCKFGGSSWKTIWKLTGNWWKTICNMEIDGKLMDNWWEIDGKLMENGWEIDGKVMANWWDIDGNWWESLMKVDGIFLTNGFMEPTEIYDICGSLNQKIYDIYRSWLLTSPPQKKKLYKLQHVEKVTAQVTNKKTQHLHFLQQLSLTEILWGTHGKVSKMPWISMGYEHVFLLKLRDIRDIWVHWTPQNYKIYPLLNEDSFGKSMKITH